MKNNNEAPLSFRRLMIALPLLSLLWSSLVEAFIPPAFFILRKTKRKLRATHSLESTWDTRLIGPDGSVKKVKERLLVQAPNRVRSELKGKAGASSVELWNGKTQALKPQGGATVSKTRDWSCLTAALLTGTGLSGYLAALGVNTAVVSLGLYRGRKAIVIGARPPDQSQAQLWLDQENYLPLRIILHDGAVKNPNIHDYGFWGYDLSVARGRFPRFRALRINGKLQWTSVLYKLNRNPPFPQSLFDPRQL